MYRGKYVRSYAAVAAAGVPIRVVRGENFFLYIGSSRT